ncbi:MAG TPA: YciI family protein [Solirubrobacteraceae bacterium]|nr:YciI family protein [Solirubrobacteraceae bacterium]
MKYMLNVYSPNSSVWERLSEHERSAISAEYAAINETPGILGGAQLQPPTSATTVRVHDGSTLATDGPFIETKEALGGYWLIEVEDLDAAIELAARVPAARLGGAVEVRPVVER